MRSRDQVRGGKDDILIMLLNEGRLGSAPAECHTNFWNQELMKKKSVNTTFVPQLDRISVLSYC